MSEHEPPAVRTVLAVDTATDAVVTGVATIGVGGVGDTDDAVAVLSDRGITDHRRHAELLTTLMSEALAVAGVRRDQLDAVVVGCGPGPFTGLRVGMATGAAFGDALGLPVYGVCSLDAMAADAARHTPRASSILVVTDARRREVYWARYRDGHRVHGPEVAAPADVAVALSAEPADVVAGSPTHLAACGWTGEPPLLTTPTVTGLAAAAAPALLVGASPEPLVPLYLRRPDAVERKDQRVQEVTPR
ncbi:tRNA (adenosine(37)-N6)-threonylcarbamoyltransferase complex dimerization subunit type 1 TsaB [Gordonia sp. NPDC003425]